MHRAEHRGAIFCLKHIPVIMFVLMWFYTILALCGINLWIADTIVGCSILPSVLIFSLSKLFKFCWIHKAATVYSLTVDILINVDKYIGLSNLLIPIQALVCIIGLFLFIMLVIKMGWLKYIFKGYGQNKRITDASYAGK